MNEETIAIVSNLISEEAYNDMIFGEPDPVQKPTPEIKADICHYTRIHNCKYWDFGCYSPVFPCEYMNGEKDADS